MKPTLQASRSIAAEFIRRLYAPIALTVGIVFVCLLALSVWLTTLSIWWWIAVGFMTFLLLLLIGILLVLRIIVNNIAPTRSRTQKTQTKAFVDKLQNVSEVIQTPKFILLFRIIRDVIWRRKTSYLSTLTNDTASLKRDFMALADTFQ